MKVRTLLIPSGPAHIVPKRSKRLANQSLSIVPAAKRGEVLMMQRFGLVKGNALANP